MANVFVVIGLCLVTGAGWLVHPAAGLATAGVAAIAIGIGIVRESDNDS